MLRQCFFSHHRSVLFFVGPLVCLIAAQTLQSADGPLTPEQAIASFKLEPGLRIELVAAEPLVIDPVAIAFDEQGRMFVAENRGYPVGPAKDDSPLGRIALLEDTDGDGKYDKRTTFADGLTFPNGVMPWKGGVYVTCAPNVYYLKDTDGDGVADVKQIVFKGFQDLSTTQLRVSHPTFAIDNWVYLTSGLTAAKVISPEHPELPAVLLNRVDGRFRPGMSVIEPTAGTAQFGQTFDNFGRRFICSNRNHIQHVVMQLKYLKRNPHFAFSEVSQDIPDHGAACKVFPLSANITTAASHTGYFTSACGVMIYDGTTLPENYRGNSFTCEPAGNLIHRDIISSANATFVAKRAYESQEFLASPDNWFRPVNLEVGPDGALYVCDMYRKTIEHPEYLPEATRKITDFESGKDKGRIYRIVADDGRARQSLRAASGKAKNGAQRTDASYHVNLGNLSIKELCAELESPNRWWRMTAHRLLIERQDKSAATILRSLVKSGKTPEARVHSLRLLDGLNALEEAHIQTALADKHPAVREHGIQLAEPRLRQSPELVTAVLKQMHHTDARVRFQCALTLGETDDDYAITALALIAERDIADRWARAAVLSSIAGRANEFLAGIQPAAKKICAENGEKKPALVSLMSDLGRILGAEKTNAAVATLRNITLSTNETDFDWQLALLSGFADGLRGGRGISLASLMSIDSSLTPLRIDQMMRRALAIASDANEPTEQRRVAIGLASHADFATAGNPLGSLLDPRESAEIQIAAVHALTKMPGTSAGTMFVQRKRWNGYTPAVREVVLAAMMTKTNLLQALLTGVESGDVPPWTINPERRNQLMKHKDETIRNRAVALFKELQSGDRMKVYEDHKSVLALKPNATNGRAVFKNVCASCHVFENEGYSVGPDLTGIRNQPADVLLLHILVPEFEMMPIYTTYNVETKDGQSFSGLLAGETSSTVTLRQALGIEQNIPRSNIESISTGQLSLMPQELEKTMSKQDIANLIAFLKGEEKR